MTETIMGRMEMQVELDSQTVAMLHKKNLMSGKVYLPGILGQMVKAHLLKLEDDSHDREPEVQVKTE